MVETSVSIGLVLLELTALLFPVVIISLRLYLDIQDDDPNVRTFDGWPGGVWAGYLMVSALTLSAGMLILFLASQVPVTPTLGGGMLALLFALVMMLALSFGIARAYSRNG